MIILLLTVAVTLIDQVSKAIAFSAVRPVPWIEPALNPDLALGLAGGPTGLEITAAAAGLMLAWRLVVRRGRSDVEHLAFGVVAGGCVGNLLDRASTGAVRDFLVGPGILFNLADVALLTGLAGLLLVRLPVGRAWARRRSPLAPV